MLELKQLFGIFLYFPAVSKCCSKSLPQQNKSVSSANNVVFSILETSHISIISFKINNNGPNIEPWGTQVIYLDILVPIVQVVLTLSCLSHLFLMYLIIIHGQHCQMLFFFLEILLLHILSFILHLLFPPQNPLVQMRLSS